MLLSFQWYIDFIFKAGGAQSLASARLDFRANASIYPKNLSVILGVLQSNYSSPRDGYRIYPLSISDLNALGKHLDKEKGQDDALNRTILDILDKISQLEGVGTDPDMEEVAIHAAAIRNAFFDDKKRMEDVIPPVLLVKASYHEKEVAPRKRVPLKEKLKREKEKEKG